MLKHYSKYAGAALFIGSAQFLLAMIASESLYPGYSIHNNYISDLGIGNTSFIFNSSIIIYGILIMIASFYLYRIYIDKGFTIVITLSAVGAIGVGLFPEGSPYALHTITSLITFLFAAVTAMIVYRHLTVPFSYISVTLGVISIIALFLYIAKIFGPIGVGGMERMIVYPALLWALGFSGYLLNSNHTK